MGTHGNHASYAKMQTLSVGLEVRSHYGLTNFKIFNRSVRGLAGVSDVKIYSRVLFDLSVE